MNNGRNKIVAATVCGVIVGAVGTSIVGNFQANEQVNSIEVPNSSEFENYYNGESQTTDSYAHGNTRSDRDGASGKGNHHQGEAAIDSSESIDILSGEYSDGIYEGTASGYSSGLNVQVTISNGQISNVKVISHNETPGFCERAIETVPSEIVSAQSTNVDTVSGATYTSVGIINAVNSALTSAQTSSGSESNSIIDSSSDGDL